MKPFMKFSAALLLTLLVPLLVPRAVAQIVIGPGGSAVQTFNSLPTVADGWSGLSVGTLASTFTTAVALDGHVITNASTNQITVALTANGTVPPTTAVLPRWNSAGLYLQTKASANDYLLLLARLRNGTGSNVTHVIVSYDWDQKAANPVNENIPGHRAFYSLTGLPGSWTLIPEFSNFTTNSTAQTLTATLPVGAWTNGALLHLLWADDNGPGGFSDPQEGGYTLDNFGAVVIPATVPVLLTPLADQSVAPGETLALTVSVSGAPPLVYQWRKNGADISGATNAGLTLVNAQAGDSGNYSVLVTNVFGSVTASNLVTVACAAPVALTTQPQSQTLLAGGESDVERGRHRHAAVSLPMAAQRRAAAGRDERDVLVG